MVMFVSHVPTRRFGFIDLFVLLFVFALLFSILHLGSGMVAPLTTDEKIVVSTDPADLPYYAGRSVLRMFLAYGASLAFTLLYGSLAAKNKTAEKLLIPLLDILQSLPVLGFLSVTISMFMGMTPGNLFGVELASIFAIFTGQAWNMTFSYYHSLITLPQDLQEASTVLGFNWWQKFIRLEVPFATISLVWNSMMSFGGGWFFLAASEAITVLNRDIRLPGLGSFTAAAAEAGDMTALCWAIFAMVATIVLIDQLFWRPIVVWSQKFKMERTESQIAATSFVYDFLQRSMLAGWLGKTLIVPLLAAASCIMNGLAHWGERMQSRFGRQPRRFGAPNVLKGLLGLVAVAFVGQQSYAGLAVLTSLSAESWLEIVRLGALTFGRVMVATGLGILWAVPVGVWIGSNPRWSRFCQPLVQVAASFPANMIYPLVAILYLRFAVNFEIGAIPLMMLGTQWYILFNVIAGAMAIPNDLSEAATIFKLTGWQRWRKMILPAIFPHLGTSCITASGGAWNASIVSELVIWRENRLEATGLGAFISRVTEAGDWAGILAGILVMCLFVVFVNRFFWRRLYELAETQYHLN